MRHATRKFVFGLLLPFLLYLGGAVLLDPVGLLGAPLIGERSFNSMQIKEEIVEGLRPRSYNGLILGTSSLMTIDSTALEKRTGLHVFNYSLFNSRPHQALAAYRHFKARNGVPGYVFVGVDFFAYNDGMAAQEDIRMTRYVRRYDKDGGDILEYVRTVGRVLFSVDTARLLLNRLEGIAQRCEPARRIDANGELIYIAVDRLIAEGRFDFEKAMRKSSRTDTPFYTSYRSFSESLRDLRRLTDEMRRDGVDYTIVLPALYRDYDLNLRKLSLYEDFYVQIKDIYGEAVVDWRDAPGTDDASNFIDARHIRRVYSRRLVDRFRRFTFGADPLGD